MALEPDRPRILNIVWGAWLLASAFSWPHSAGHFLGAWLGGVLIIGFAVLAMSGLPGARHANTVLGLWLALSGFLLPTVSRMTLWNHLALGALVILTSINPSFAKMRARPLR
jgi:hypothetical protein